RFPAVPCVLAVTSVASRSAEAAARRSGLAGTDVVRLVDDAADGCDGYVVDRYGDVVRVEVRGASWRDAEAIARACADATAAVHGVGLLRPSGGKSAMRVLFGSPPPAHVVHE